MGRVPLSSFRKLLVNRMAFALLPDAPPVLASNQMQTDIVSGKAASSSAKSNYGFVDGHVETLKFSDVYVHPDRNRFDPKIHSIY